MYCSKTSIKLGDRKEMKKYTITMTGKNFICVVIFLWNEEPSLIVRTNEIECVKLSHPVKIDLNRIGTLFFY